MMAISKRKIERNVKGPRLRPGIKVAPGNPCRLLELIPEIRNLIYDELLPVDYNFHGSHVARWPSEQLVVPVINLLFTSRGMYAELAPIVYGTRMVELAVNDQTIAWLRGVGSMLGLVRYVKLRDVTNRAKLISLLHQLKQAKHLQILSMAGPEWQQLSSYLDADELAGALSPLCRALRKPKGGVNAKQDVIQMIHVETSLFYPEAEPGHTGIAAEKYFPLMRQYTINVRAELDALLS